MTHLLATFKYVFLFSYWVQQFDELKRAVTCTALLWWMHSIWYQLLHVHCLNFIKSWSSVFDKLLRTLTSFDLSSSVAFDMEWLMLHMPLFERISGAYSLGVILHLTWYTHFSLSSLFNLCFLLYIFVALFYCFLFEF